MDPIDKKFSCIILAGGEGRRVGGQDKGLISYKNATLIQHVINSVQPQSDEIIISANRNIDTYKEYGFKIISDDADHYLGPLAGITAALPHCKHNWVLVVPCDMPFLPNDLTTALAQRMSNSNICVVESEKKLQLVFLLNKILLPSLLSSLEDGQLRLIKWVKSQNPSVVSFPETHSFKNFNHLDELM